jgi:hypothetical protein
VLAATTAAMVAMIMGRRKESSKGSGSIAGRGWSDGEVVEMKVAEVSGGRSAVSVR